MYLFILLGVVVVIATAHTPSEWKDIFDNVDE